jgi:hypothetical protein
MSETPNNEGRNQALGVLRDIWGTDEAAEPEIRALEPTGKICKNTAMLGIKGMEDEGMADAMRSDWRRQLANEGKLPSGARSIAELRADGEL